ncbi:MAG: hypothetical protein FWD99_03430 [Oscillospiraceae bacterium]|nr:hypothetical protein [Oscillospiraceae bacterium]
MESTLILAAPPEYLQTAQRQSQNLAHMAYRIGPDFRLFRANLPLSLRGGFMVLDDGDGTLNGTGTPDVLANQVIRECIHRGFDGVILAFRRTSPALHATAAILSGKLRRHGGQLYLPESYAADSDWANVLIPTAISGGSLTARLQEVCGYYGKERICLDIERVAMDFCLPSEQGTGRRLSSQELYALVREKDPQSYFSQDLCAYYFTYQDGISSHFVLYDDAGSIRKKIFLARKMGIHHTMVLYPEVEDILSNIIST